MNDSLIQSLSKNADKDNEIMANYVSFRLQREGYGNVIPIDCGSLTLNKQHNISEFLKNNLSRAEIKATQVASIDAARKDFITKLGIPLAMKDFYGINEEDYDIHISDAIKYGKNVGVVLSCAANDLMFQGWINPIGYLLDKIFIGNRTSLKRLRILLEDERLRDNVVDGLKRNIEQVLGINENAKIITMGIFRPKSTPKKFASLFEEINDKIQDTTESYNQSYVDISDVKSKMIDFHPVGPNYMKMQERVAKKLIRRFNRPEIDIQKFEYTNTGLAGAINDVIILLKTNTEVTDSFIATLTYKYNCSREEIMKFMYPLVDGRIDEIETHAKVYTNANDFIKK
jgi:hypothetical protein